MFKYRLECDPYSIVSVLHLNIKKTVPGKGKCHA